MCVTSLRQEVAEHNVLEKLIVPKEYWDSPRYHIGEGYRVYADQPEYEAFDEVEIVVRLRHKDSLYDPGAIVQEAGARYLMGSTPLEDSAKFDLNDLQKQKVGQLAQDAIDMLLDHRQSTDHFKNYHYRSRLVWSPVRGEVDATART